MGAQGSKEQSKGAGKQLCTLCAHGTTVLQVLLQATPEHSRMSSGSAWHRAGTVTTAAEQLEQATLGLACLAEAWI